MFGKVRLIVVIIATFFPLTESFIVGYGSENLGKFARLAQALKYGDDCSWEAEEYRRNFTRDTLMTSSIKNLATAATEMTNTVVRRGYQLCSATELFVCDKKSLKCACGDPGYESLFEVNRSLYILENAHECRWNTNTYCISEGLRPQGLLGMAVDYQCKSGASCTFRNGDSCTLENLLRNVELEASVGNLMKELISGRICTCKEDRVEVGNIENNAKLHVRKDIIPRQSSMLE